MNEELQRELVSIGAAMNPTRFEMEQPDPCHRDSEDILSGQVVLTIEDEGAGKYAVLSCCNFAFDDLADFDEWASKVRGAIAVGLGAQS